MSQPDADTEQDDPLALADPDDYHRTQRLKEIHQARQEVSQKVSELDINESKVGRIRYDSIQELAHATAMYVNELLPMIEAADIDGERLSLPDACYHDSIVGFAKSMGIGEDGRPVNPSHSTEVYRRCNAILADLKPLIEEDDNNEWEV
jgi:hypothetical protein